MNDCVFCGKETTSIACDMPVCFHCYLQHDWKDLEKHARKKRIMQTAMECAGCDQAVSILSVYTEIGMLCPICAGKSNEILAYCDTCGQPLRYKDAKIVNGNWYCKDECNYN